LGTRIDRNYFEAGGPSHRLRIVADAAQNLIRRRPMQRQHHRLERSVVSEIPCAKISEQGYAF
jgi:hypothetical protein